MNHTVTAKKGKRVERVQVTTYRNETVETVTIELSPAQATQLRIHLQDTVAKGHYRGGRSVEYIGGGLGGRDQYGYRETLQRVSKALADTGTGHADIINYPKEA